MPLFRHFEVTRNALTIIIRLLLPATNDDNDDDGRSPSHTQQMANMCVFGLHRRLPAAMDKWEEDKWNMFWENQKSNHIKHGVIFLSHNVYVNFNSRRVNKHEAK